MNTVRTFEIYLVEDKPYGYEVSTSLSGRDRRYDTSYDFAGKSAHIRVVSNDPGVDRNISLGFATAIANGTFKTFSIDWTEIAWAMQERRENPKN